MEAEQADIVVIGMGPGGEYLAGRLAEAGLSVVGVEDRLVGGECPYWGCVPSKMMIRASNLLAEGRRIPGMAGSAEVVPDWAPVAQRIRKEATDNWDDTATVNRFAGKGGRLARGSGRITAPGEVTVTGQDGAPPRVFRASHDGTCFTGEASGHAVTADRLLVATGRRTRLAALGIGAVGLNESERTIGVDERMRAADGVWAIGDITGKGAFTHMSMYQAGIVVADILGEPGSAAQYHAVPRVTFTDPEVGAVGLTEAQARDQGLDVRVGTAQIPESARGWIHKAGNDGFIKLVEDAGAGVLVGATSAGPAGGEVLSPLVVAVHGDVPVSRLQDMIYAYPTFHRAIEDALRDLTGD